MGTLGATQATDEGNQGVEMTFLVTGGLRVKELHEALLDGTRAAIRVTHGAPPDRKVVSMEEHTRAGAYHCLSSNFLYGSEI